MFVRAAIAVVAAAFAGGGEWSAAFASGAPTQEHQLDSIEREWRTRHFAIDIEGTREEWLAVARSTDWVERWSVLDALLRAVRSGGLARAMAERTAGSAANTLELARELARRALDDERPNVMAAGAELLVELEAAWDASADQVERLARSPLAEARLAAADLMGAQIKCSLAFEAAVMTSGAGCFDTQVTGSGALLANVLEALAVDSDAEVRAAAGRALLARLARLDGGAEEFFDYLLEVWRVGGDGDLVEWLTPLVDDAPSKLELLARLEVDPSGDAAHARVADLVSVACAAGGAPLDAEEFVDIWCRSTDWTVTRDAFFERAAGRLGTAVAAELVRAADLCLAVFGGAATGLDTVRGGEREASLARLVVEGADGARYPLSSVLLRAANAAGGARVLLGQLLRGGDGLFARGLEVLGPDIFGWTDELANAAWERAEEAECSEIVLDAWIVAARSGDRGAIRALARLLDASDEDSERARMLFKSLARLPDPGPALDALERHFLDTSESEALRLVTMLPHIAMSSDVRRRLLGLGQADPGVRGTVARALQAYAGDEEAGWYLERWSIELLAELDGLDEPQRRRATERAAEILPALGVVAGASGTEAFVQVLDWSIGREPGVGRIAIRELATSAPGRTALWDYTSEHLDRELRSELALALCGEDAERAEWSGRENILVELLRGAGAGDSIDDRERRIDALARLDSPQAHAELLSLASARGDEATATSAAGALGATSIEPEQIAAYFRQQRDFDRRRAAMRALTQRGAAEQLVAIASDWELLSRSAADVVDGWADSDWPRRVLGIDLALPGHIDELPILALELRAALVTLDAAPANWRVELFEAAGAAARLALESRFAGHGRAATDFLWTEELELVAITAARGDVASLLDAISHRERLDGRLLLAIAEQVAPYSGPLTLELTREALVALLGEGSAATSEVLHARLLAADAAWRSGLFAECALHTLALVDPFAERPLGRGNSAARPVPGGNPQARQDFARRAHWAKALAAAQRGNRLDVRRELDAAAALVWTAAGADRRAAERQREVKRMASELLDGTR